MHAELLAIGSELLSGHTVNTNVAYLARRLQDVGITCARQTAVPDEPREIVESLKEALVRSPVVITTGGLGPTEDDLTMEAISRATGRPLIYQPSVARRIRTFYRQHHRQLNPLALRQASLPRGASAFPNPAGTAPGMWLALKGRLLIALPGVPQEMRAIMERSVIPRLRKHLGRSPIVSRTIRTIGMVELEIQAMMRRLSIPAEVSVGFYPHLMMVDIRLTVMDRPARMATRLMDRLERSLRRRLGVAVYGVDDQTLEGVVGEALVRHRTTLAIAESCTGGLIADRVTNVPGSSRYFLLSIVAYHNRMKQGWLGVSSLLLARHGTVSAQVARAMAQGIRQKAGADLGVAVTGIAGPSGGSRHKPVGLVYLAVADRRRTAVKRYRFHGDRLAIKAQTADGALDQLRRWVLKLPG